MSEFFTPESREKRFKEYKEQFAREKDPKEIMVLARFLRFQDVDDLILTKFKKHVDDLYHYDAVALIDYHIDFLLDKSRFQDALEALSVYDEKPYISQEVNDLIKEYRQKTYILMLPKSAKADVAASHLRDSLYSREPRRVLNAVQQIIENIDRPEIKDLLKPILLNEQDDLLKNFVLYELFDRFYEGTIEVKKFGKLHTINFAKFRPKMVKYTYEFGVLVDEFLAEQKNVTIRFTMQHISKKHALYLYPYKLDPKDYDLVLHLFYVRAANYYEKDFTLEEHAKKNNLDLNRLIMLRDRYNIEKFDV